MRSLLLRALLLGLLLLPPGSFTAAIPVRSHAASSVHLPYLGTPSAPLRVLSSRIYRDDYPLEVRHILVGELVNDGDTVVHSPWVIVRFFDSKDNLVEARRFSAVFPEVAPGQRVPFKTFGFVVDPTVVDYEIEPESSDYVVPGFNPLMVLTQTVQEGERLVITGEVRYATGPIMASARVAATFYDADGNVVDVAVGGLTPLPLRANEPGHYRIVVNRQIEYATIRVQGGGFCY